MTIQAIDHIELTVSDLDRSRNFYEKLPGFKVVATHPGFLMFSCGSFRLGIADHKGEAAKDKFSEFRTGLDHVSLTVAEKADLESALNFFESNAIPHGEIKKLSNDTYVLAFRDPDNIALELCYRD